MMYRLLSVVFFLHLFIRILVSQYLCLRCQSVVIYLQLYDLYDYYNKWRWGTRCNLMLLTWKESALVLVSFYPTEMKYEGVLHNVMGKGLISSVNDAKMRLVLLGVFIER